MSAHMNLPGRRVPYTPSVFHRLDDENIWVPESLRYYPYRATFDFECYFDTKQLPLDSDKVHWVDHHVPLSVSVVSNVPGHEQVQCLVTDGDAEFVANIMAILRAMGDAAYEDGREGARRTIARRCQQKRVATDAQSVQNVDGATLLMSPSVIRHRVQFGQVRSQRHHTVSDNQLPCRSKDRGSWWHGKRTSRYRIIFRHQTQQHVYVYVDGSTEIPRQLHHRRVQLRQVFENARC